MTELNNIQENSKELNFDFKNSIQLMVKIRTSEKFIRDAFWDEKIFSFLHLSIGQEASAVGVASVLNNKDLMLGNHRSHGHYLAKGGNLEKMIYEVFGDQRGCCKGFGGSMHMLDREVGFTGSTPILGSIPSIAVGQAFACKELNLGNVTVVYLGDGAAEEGSFMESVNLAANKKCSVIFVIEDNKYSVNSNMIDRKSTNYSHKKLFEGLGSAYFRENGQDVRKVHEVSKKARELSLSGQPVVLHLDIDRMHAHSGPILEEKTEAYRGNDTVEQRMASDCILLASQEAVNNGNSEKEVSIWIEDEINRTMEELKRIKSTIRVRNFV